MAQPRTHTARHAHGREHRARARAAWLCVQALHADGAPVPPGERGHGDGSWLSQLELLARGEARVVRFHLSEPVRFDRLGTHTLRVLHHDGAWIALDDHAHELLVCASRELVVRTAPRKIVTGARTLRRLRERIGGLDVHGSVMLLHGATPGRVYEPAPGAEPYESVVAFGWLAVPASFERLDDPRTTPELKRWVLALLYDVTQDVDPDARHERTTGALGAFRSRTFVHADTILDDMPGPGWSMSRTGAPPIALPARAELTRRWREPRPRFAVEYDD